MIHRIVTAWEPVAFGFRRTCMHVYTPGHTYIQGINLLEPRYKRDTATLKEKAPHGAWGGLLITRDGERQATTSIGKHYPESYLGSAAAREYREAAAPLERKYAARTSLSENRVRLRLETNRDNAEMYAKRAVAVFARKTT